jgi:hypothetical protein
MWAIRACGQAAKMAASKPAGLGPSDWGPLLAGLTLEPRPISVDALLATTPYMARRAYEERLASLEEKGLLARAEHDGYLLTGPGEATIRAVTAAGQAEMARAEPLPASDLERLATLLWRAVAASLDTPPPARERLELNRRLDPGRSAPPLVRVEHYLSDLNAFRSAVHIEAWQRHGTTGLVWETFTYVWRGEAPTLADQQRQLARRGHTEAEHAGALSELVARGWIEGDHGAYRVTADGHQVRQDVEDETDRSFYEPWATLDSAEIEDMHRLLTAVAAGLERRPG